MQLNLKENRLMLCLKKNQLKSIKMILNSIYVAAYEQFCKLLSWIGRSFQRTHAHQANFSTYFQSIEGIFLQILANTMWDASHVDDVLDESVMETILAIGEYDYFL